MSVTDVLLLGGTQVACHRDQLWSVRLFPLCCIVMALSGQQVLRESTQQPSHLTATPAAFPPDPIAQHVLGDSHQLEKQDLCGVHAAVQASLRSEGISLPESVQVKFKVLQGWTVPI